jgi:hypothetical protein
MSTTAKRAATYMIRISFLRVQARASRSSTPMVKRM